MDILESIDAAKAGFEQSFLENNFYNRQTADKQHLNAILSNIKVEKSMKLLDLGTGNGFLAFPLAEKNPDANVYGLDIVENALEINRLRAARAGLHNLKFLSYDGLLFPFADGYFDVVIIRYALHHFPVAEQSFFEIARVLKKN